jgi:hypothetical protein
MSHDRVTRESEGLGTLLVRTKKTPRDGGLSAAGQSARPKARGRSQRSTCLRNAHHGERFQRAEPIRAWGVNHQGYSKEELSS